MTADTEVVTDQSKKTKKGSKEPGRFTVIFHNDDMTPMDFVSQLIETIFHHDTPTARDLTIKIHMEGRAVVGVYTYEVAEQKSIESVAIARNNGFPLTVTVEPE
jgi:ATP-dependent Clp protease adaptor protein ClpS